MRSVISVVVLLCLMLQSLFQLGLIAYYTLNADEIEAEYCVNKDKPDLCCKGRCYISGELDKTANQMPDNRCFEERDIPFFIIPEFKSIPRLGLSLKSNSNTLPADPLSGYMSCMFHPPEQA